MSMTSSRPYLLRALHEWILENQCTPYVVINAWHDGVMVPQEYVKDGQIVLNLSPGAVHNLHISNEEVSFNGRFGGVPTPVHVPVAAVMGIYARENGQGMVFETEKPTPPSDDDVVSGPGSGSKAKSARPSLRVVK